MERINPEDRLTSRVSGEPWSNEVLMSAFESKNAKPPMRSSLDFAHILGSGLIPGRRLVFGSSRIMGHLKSTKMVRSIMHEP